MVEDREVEFLVFSREIVGRHALGDKMTEVSPIPGNKVFQLFEANELMLIRIGSSGIGLRKITRRVKVAVEEIEIVEHQPCLLPRACGPGALRGIKTVLDLELFFLPIHDFHNTPLCRINDIELSMHKGQGSGISLNGNLEHGLIFPDRFEAKDMP